MLNKASLTKQAKALAGFRLPLPGQSRDRESALRAELTEAFQPTNMSERIWIGDVAYYLAVIEVTQAQIAAFRRRIIIAAYAEMARGELVLPEHVFQVPYRVPRD